MIPEWVFFVCRVPFLGGNKPLLGPLGASLEKGLVSLRYCGWLRNPVRTTKVTGESFQRILGGARFRLSTAWVYLVL